MYPSKMAGICLLRLKYLCTLHLIKVSLIMYTNVYLIKSDKEINLITSEFLPHILQCYFLNLLNEA